MPLTKTQAVQLSNAIHKANSNRTDTPGFKDWSGYYATNALCHMIEKYGEQLPPFNDYFHKSFRQVDILEDGHMDMVFWNLLNATSVFWEVVEKPELWNYEREAEYEA